VPRWAVSTEELAAGKLLSEELALSYGALLWLLAKEKIIQGQNLAALLHRDHLCE